MQVPTSKHNAIDCLVGSVWLLLEAQAVDVESDGGRLEGSGDELPFGVSLRVVQVDMELIIN